MRVYIGKRAIALKPAHAIGKGGEADVYDIGGGLALKLFKPPDHPDYAGFPEQQDAASERLAQHQMKLRDFPKNLPKHVIAPIDLATDSPGGKIAGYTMPLLQSCEVLLRYGEPAFRNQGVPAEDVVRILLDLLATVRELHGRGVVIGDFNDLNVLVSKNNAYLIDADSFQFAGYLAKMFTERFVDPLLCDPAAVRLVLRKPHNPQSDWYAFNVMAFRSLLLTDPYGGIYKPKDSAKRIPHSARPLKRVTVFDSEVVYPKPAKPLAALPDDFLHHFVGVFTKDARSPFPVKFLEELLWSRCSCCGVEHARRTCPVCSHAVAVPAPQHLRVVGTVTLDELFKTSGVIVAAELVNGIIRWLSYEKGVFKREDGREIFRGQLEPGMKFRLSGDCTWAGQGHRVLKFKRNASPETLAVDTYAGIPQFEQDGQRLVWLENGLLMRETPLGSENAGSVLANQTFLWAGPRFGFGLYRAGGYVGAFVFKPRSGSINDSIRLPQLPGVWVNANCIFASERCWLSLTFQYAGQLLIQTVVINAEGHVEAQERIRADDSDWQATAGAGCAMDNKLFVPTDEGLVRVELHGQSFVKTRTFVETEPFLDNSSSLLAGREDRKSVV
jgi:hypothetical protein